MIGTHAARTDATERQPVLCDMEKSSVDCDATGTDSFENPILRNFVIAETVERQCSWSLIDKIERFFERSVRNNRQDGPEYLILQQRAACRASSTTVGAIAVCGSSGFVVSNVAPPAFASAKASRSRAR